MEPQATGKKGKKKEKKGGKARSKSKTHKFSNINAKAFISVIQDSKCLTMPSIMTNTNEINECIDPKMIVNKDK